MGTPEKENSKKKAPKKDNRGGKRPNSGRPKAPYETTTVAFRVRVELAQDVKKLVKKYVAERLKKLKKDS